MINAGRLDQRITLQQRAAGADALGQESTTWTDLATVWASVTTKRGREFFAAGAVQSEAAAVFRIRYRADVITLGSGALRVMWGSQPYDVIEPPQDLDAQHVAIDLMCTTGARDGR
jgi:SPP1 family predicted phage head-tail adaptor